MSENIGTVAKEIGDKMARLERENNELRTRVAGLEKDALVNFDAIKELHKLNLKNATLLKASEGMEKALVVFSDMVDYLNAKWFRGADGLKTNRCFTLEDNKDAWQKETIEIESLIKAKQSLADFRAVKETK